MCYKKQFTVLIGCHKHLPEAVTERCSWNQLKSDNIETLYLLITLSQNQCRSTVRKHVLLRYKHEHQHSADIFVKNIFNPFHGSVFFLYLQKSSESQSFLMFSECLKMEQCLEMVQESFNLQLLILLLA